MLSDLPAFRFDSMIREMGWHFMWLPEACTRKGFGVNRQSAIDRALAHALSGISKHFNAAELNSVREVKVFGLHIATVTLHTRQIQESASLTSAEAG